MLVGKRPIRARLFIKIFEEFYKDFNKCEGKKFWCSVKGMFKRAFLNNRSYKYALLEDYEKFKFLHRKAEKLTKGLNEFEVLQAQKFYKYVVAKLEDRLNAHAFFWPIIIFLFASSLAGFSFWFSGQRNGLDGTDYSSLLTAQLHTLEGLSFAGLVMLVFFVSERISVFNRLNAMNYLLVLLDEVILEKIK